jgi:HD-GYP domain-containing protein (c-di-GMP phosphodiesterase class II)
MGAGLETRPAVRLPELLASLSLAIDIGMGQPLEFGLSTCVLAVELGAEAGLADEELGETWCVSLLRHVGCTADNAVFSGLVGDERAFRVAASRIDSASPRAMFPLMLRSSVGAFGVAGAAARVARMARDPARFQEGVRAVCEVGRLLSDRLGLDDRVGRALELSPERWDGKGFLKRAAAEGVPEALRVAQVAEAARGAEPLGGADAAVAVVRERAGKALDPRLAEVFCARAGSLLAERGASHWEAALELAPAIAAGDSGTRLAAVAEFVDLKSPYTLGHSAGVAALAADAAERAGLDADTVRLAGLVHDVGRVGISSLVWEKEGPLTPDEWERVRLHPYYTERVFARSEGLSPLGRLASLHHERLDGSGYHRGSQAASLPAPARLLAAADAFRAMTEARPHREALAAEAAAAELRRGARDGQLDADAVECVLAAAGHARRRPVAVAGLTGRELEVLRLLARGLSKREIAQELTIAPKTADAHVQHIYAKIGVSTRAAAAVFAMQHDLL